MHSTRPNRNWKELPNKVVHIQRKTHVALRLLLLGLPIVLIIILAFSHFYSRLNSLLDAEKQSQYENRAQGCALLIVHHLESDQKRLLLLAQSLSGFTLEQSLHLVESLGESDISLVVDAIADAAPFSVDAAAVVHRTSVETADGKSAVCN